MAVTIKKIHRLTGLVLLLPLITWAITGTIFLTKPGYGDAYQKLSVKQYPLQASFSNIESDSTWLEVRHIKTILGDHLLVKDHHGWQQRSVESYDLRERPANNDLTRLLEDAFTQHTERYGKVATIDDDRFITTTGVVITIDWPTLSLTQRGNDTRRIGLLYKIHYLQWTGINWLDKILGVVGLLLLITVTLLGLRLSFGKPVK